MFLIVCRLSVIGYGPVNAAVLLVRKSVPQDFIGLLRVPKAALVLQKEIGIAEKPQNPAVQDSALFRFFVQHKICIHETVESAVLVVTEPVPERDQVIYQMFSDFLCKH